MRISELTFEQITDIKEGKPTKRKVLFLHSLKQAIIYYLKQNKNISLYEFSQNFIDEISQNDREFKEFMDNLIIDEENDGKIKELSQRVSNLGQSVHMVTELNDRIRILEKGGYF